MSDDRVLIPRSVLQSMVDAIADTDEEGLSGHAYPMMAARALLAAERLRAPVGGDGKSDREVLAEEASKTSRLEAEAIREGNFSYTNALWRWEVALAAMARVRCAIPDGWRPIETAPDGEAILTWDSFMETSRQVRLENGKFLDDWDGTTADDLTHWMPLPHSPSAPTLPIAKGDER